MNDDAFIKFLASIAGILLSVNFVVLIIDAVCN